MGGASTGGASAWLPSQCLGQNNAASLRVVCNIPTDSLVAHSAALFTSDASRGRLVCRAHVLSSESSAHATAPGDIFTRSQLQRRQRTHDTRDAARGATTGADNSTSLRSEAIRLFSRCKKARGVVLHVWAHISNQKAA